MNMTHRPLIIAAAAAAIFAAAPAMAQTTTAPTGAAAAAAAAAATAATAAAPTTQRANGVNNSPHISTTQGGGIMINFKDANIDTVLDELSAVAGFIVVKEVKPTGTVTLVS